jgi:hypothetical protein
MKLLYRTGDYAFIISAMGKLFVIVFAVDYTPAGQKPQVIYQPERFFLFDLLSSFRSRLWVSCLSWFLLVTTRQPGKNCKWFISPNPFFFLIYYHHFAVGWHMEHS